MDVLVPLVLWGVGFAARCLVGIRRSDSGNPEIITGIAIVAAIAAYVALLSKIHWW
jgi:hypothetical protein